MYAYKETLRDEMTRPFVAIWYDKKLLTRKYLRTVIKKTISGSKEAYISRKCYPRFNLG